MDQVVVKAFTSFVYLERLFLECAIKLTIRLMILNGAMIIAIK